VAPGNRTAVVVGQFSERFWAAEADARQAIRAAVVSAKGHTECDAPPMLACTAESVAQSVLIRDSAYQRIAESGGPLASSGRVRRSFAVWCAAVDTLERATRLLGLERTAREIADPLAELRRAVAEANARREETP
jgi:hypothetical protein